MKWKDMDQMRKFKVALIWIWTPLSMCLVTIMYYDHLLSIGKLYILIGMWIGMLPGLPICHLIYIIGIHDEKIFEAYKEIKK